MGWSRIAQYKEGKALVSSHFLEPSVPSGVLADINVSLSELMRFLCHAFLCILVSCCARESQEPCVKDPLCWGKKDLATIVSLFSLWVTLSMGMEPSLPCSATGLISDCICSHNTQGFWCKVSRCCWQTTILIVCLSGVILRSKLRR